jgi:hypothetical protein
VGAVLLQRDAQGLIDIFDRNEFEFLFRFLRYIDKVFFVELRDDHGGNASAHGGQTFFLYPADRQHESAQCDFTCHGDIGAHRRVAEERSERGEHGDAR